jgi:hypothetical protein
VGPVEIIPPPQFFVNGAPRFVKAMEKITLGVRITNSRRSPALAVRSKTNLKPMKASDTFIADYPPPKTKVTDSLSVLQPGMKIALDGLPTERAILAEEVRDLEEGTWILYYYGEITYDDIFKKARPYDPLLLGRES